MIPRYWEYSKDSSLVTLNHLTKKGQLTPSAFARIPSPYCTAYPGKGHVLLLTIAFSNFSMSVHSPMSITQAGPIHKKPVCQPS